MLKFERDLKVFAKSCKWNLAKIKLFQKYGIKARPGDRLRSFELRRAPPFVVDFI